MTYLVKSEQQNLSFLKCILKNLDIQTTATILPIVHTVIQSIIRNLQHGVFSIESGGL